MRKTRKRGGENPTDTAKRDAYRASQASMIQEAKNREAARAASAAANVETYTKKQDANKPGFFSGLAAAFKGPQSKTPSIGYTKWWGGKRTNRKRTHRKRRA